MKGIQWFISELPIVFHKHVDNTPQAPEFSHRDKLSILPLGNQFQAININGLELHEFIKFPDFFYPNWLNVIDFVLWNDNIHKKYINQHQ